MTGMASYYDSEDGISGTHLKSGDIVNFGDYRYVNAWLFGKDGLLVGNPDLSGSGYLTIPLEITKEFDNAMAHYAKVIDAIGEDITMVLRPDDGWVVETFGKAFPESYEVTYSGMDEGIYIKDGKYSGEFHEGIPYDEIITYFADQREVHASFLAWYEVTGKDNVKKLREHKESAKLTLPQSWVCDSGGGGGGSGKSHQILYFDGPKKYRKEALSAVKEYYDGYNLQISVAKKDDHYIRARGSGGNGEPSGIYLIARE
jgi:hypothetical protein